MYLYIKAYKLRDTIKETKFYIKIPIYICFAVAPI